MATVTATIFVGKAHQNHGGINPTHLILLYENSRPLLVLRDLENKEPIWRIIPSLENLIEDIYLMVAMFVLYKIPPITTKNDESELIEIYNYEERNDLYEKSKIIIAEDGIKLVINILEGSHLLSLIDKMHTFPCDFEVTLPAKRKEYNIWSNRIETKGI